MAARVSIKTGIILVVLVGIFVAIGFVAFDVLFSKPELLQGIVVDKLYVPEKNTTSPHVLPYGKYKSYDYTISTEKQEQWIAFVNVEGQVLKVIAIHIIINPNKLETLCVSKNTMEIY
jgi:hypothetical protein